MTPIDPIVVDPGVASAVRQVNGALQVDAVVELIPGVVRESPLGVVVVAVVAGAVLKSAGVAIWRSVGDLRNPRLHLRTALIYGIAGAAIVATTLDSGSLDFRTRAFYAVLLGKVGDEAHKHLLSS